MDAPPRDITRTATFELVRAKDGSDGLTLSGYAAVFDTPTRIDSWEGKFDEQIARGAFRKTIRERTPVLQFDHGQHPMVGSLPIGTITSLREDDHGLFVEARMHDNWLVQPVRDAIREGSIGGMSFRFQVVKDAWDESREVPSRTINEVRLFELGPVVFPAYEETSVGVRAREIAQQLADPSVRVDVARALLSGTPVSLSDGPAEGAGSDDGAADSAAEPVRHSGLSSSHRERTLALLMEGIIQ